jgi:hypothetical protein
MPWSSATCSSRLRSSLLLRGNHGSNAGHLSRARIGPTPRYGHCLRCDSAASVSIKCGCGASANPFKKMEQRPHSRHSYCARRQQASLCRRRVAMIARCSLLRSRSNLQKKPNARSTCFLLIWRIMVKPGARRTPPPQQIRKWSCYQSAIAPFIRARASSLSVSMYPNWRIACA